MRVRAALLGALGAVVLPLLGTPAVAAPSPPGTVTIGVLALPQGLNPSTADDDSQPALDATAAVLPSVFRAGTTVPQLDRSLFSSAAVTGTSPFTVTYVVRTAARWSDGTPLRSADFRLAWQAQSGASALTHPVSTDGYRDIRGVTGDYVPGGRRVRVVFNRPYAEWRGLFSSLLPAQSVGLEDWDTAFTVDTPPPSAGPYEVVASTPDTLTLSRNLAYAGPRPSVSRLVFRRYASRAATVSALRRGEVQLVLPGTDPGDVLPLRALAAASLGAVVAKPVTSLFYEHLDLNLRDPVAGDPAVRHAVSRAVDSAAVARAASAVYAGIPVTIAGGRLLLAGQPGYADQRGVDARGDAAGAQAIMVASGWVLGPDGVFVRAGQRAAFVLRTTAGNPLRTSEAEAVRGELALAGIEVTLRYDQPEVLFAALPRHDFPATLFGWVGAPAAASALGPVVRTGGSANYGRLSDAGVDSALTSATRATTDAGARAALKEADRLLWADGATVPLVQRPTLVAVSARLHGVTASPTLDGVLATAGSWRLDPA